MRKKLISVTYSPGYSDMRGASHAMSLECDANGEWVFTSRDREYYNAPWEESAYRVSPAALARFSSLALKWYVLFLEKRPRSKIFATDYSPWHCCIYYEKVSLGKIRRHECDIRQYRVYTPADRRLVKKLLQSFMDLRGEMISRTTREEPSD